MKTVQITLTIRQAKLIEECFHYLLGYSQFVDHKDKAVLETVSRNLGIVLSEINEETK